MTSATVLVTHGATPIPTRSYMFIKGTEMATQIYILLTTVLIMLIVVFLMTTGTILPSLQSPRMLVVYGCPAHFLVCGHKARELPSPSNPTKTRASLCLLLHTFGHNYCCTFTYSLCHGLYGVLHALTATGALTLHRSPHADLATARSANGATELSRQAYAALGCVDIFCTACL